MKKIYQNREEAFNSFISLNNTYPVHLHRQVEILTVLEGDIKAIIDEQEYTMTKGDVYIIFPNIKHSLLTKNESLVHIIIADEMMFGDYRSEFGKYIPVIPVLRAGRYSGELKTVLEKIEEHKDDERIARGYMCVAWGLMAKYLKLVKREKENEPAMLAKALNYVDNNFTSQINLEIMSKEFGVSKFYLSHIFSDNLNCNFRTYLNSRRVELAKHLLKDTDKSVMEVSLMAGFETTRTFYRAFKKEEGITPKEYKSI